MGKKVIRIPIVSLQMVKDRTLPYGNQSFESPEAVFTFTRDLIGRCDREKFLVLCLDTKNKLTHLQECSIGGTDWTTVVPKDVLKVAILSNAQSIIAVHNHPSGDPTASQADHVCTNKLRQACNLVGIQFLDHLIVGETSFFSFSNEGML